MSKTFRAVLATQNDGNTVVAIQNVPHDALPTGNVLVRVAYSSLNYKDGLAVTGKPGVMRNYPMIPGVDLAGTVEQSESPDFQVGDEVVVTGCGTSETHWGGYAEYARLRSDWIVPRPVGISLKQSMGIGTAGFTAMQCVMALEDHGLKPGSREVVVTGAAGGVGSVAIAILAKLGYDVVASSGRPETHTYLKSLGARQVIDRAVLAGASKKPMDPERWGAAVDTVGGGTLAGVLRSLVANGSVAACGLAGGSALNTTVFPFILRGVNLLGVNSVQLQNSRRREIWARLESDLPMDLLDSMIQVAPLDKVFELGAEILQGQVRGRVVIDVNS